MSSTHVDPQPGDEDTEETTSLPTLAENDEIHCANCDLVEKKTTPPKRFTEATLLDAMTGISRYVQDPDIKQTLKDTDGLGTPATQATIMDTLFRRGYLEKQKKLVYSTSLGRDMIEALPEPVALPDMTARWEQQLAEVENGALPLSIFMADVGGYTRQLIQEGKNRGALTMENAPSIDKHKAPAVHACPGDGCDGRLRRIKGQKGFFWGCTNYGGGCKETRPDSRGKPGRAVMTNGKAVTGTRKASPPANVGEKCPECKKGTIQLKALKTGKNKGTPFKGCTNFPRCKYFAWPEHGQTEADTA